MSDRFTKLPGSLAQHSRTVRLGPDIPALLIHPDWTTPTPCVLWFHGRTAYKELDPGRFQRWLRAGIATCSIDLPGHGERASPSMQSPAHSLDMIDQAVAEIDPIIGALKDPAYRAAFDTQRLGIGGMSAGGMIALRRLCDAHPFIAAAVEGTTGSLASLPGNRDRADSPLLKRLDPIANLASWRAIPLLALHSELDALVPIDGMREFLTRLSSLYREQGADPALVRFQTWPQTGAPQEHLGFGRVSNDAKSLQTAFFQEHLHRSAV